MYILRKKGRNVPMNTEFATMKSRYRVYPSQLPLIKLFLLPAKLRTLRKQSSIVCTYAFYTERETDRHTHTQSEFHPFTHKANYVPVTKWRVKDGIHPQLMGKPQTAMQSLHGHLM
ncbi:hypothetical protein KIL84_012499 [Mauremys mutica]|uniref:Uncharacterized protein n=1 Tax=Mauremys mutica TaxID=74926 RepID=A0A9D4B7X1_9SAUR|nr:hypothetical protein KIL84_012499 [Mauremys mutica]